MHKRMTHFPEPIDQYQTPAFNEAIDPVSQSLPNPHSSPPAIFISLKKDGPFAHAGSRRITLPSFVTSIPFPPHHSAHVSLLPSSLTFTRT